MSENGPHNQPPHNPYGGGEGQPYGPPPGGGPSGGQPPMPGQPGPVPGPPGYGTGGQPGYGAGQPMYAGGQPPYGGGPGQPPQQPQNGGGGSKAGLWVVLGGGAVIIVLVVAVIVTLINNNSDDGETTVTADPEAESSEEPADDDTDEPEEEDDEPVDTPAGEAPYGVPPEPCDAMTDQVESDFLLTEEGYKSVQDNNSSCTSSLADPPEGNDADSYGSFSVNYSVPYSNNESEAEAAVEYERAIEEVTGQSDYGLYLDEVMEETEVDLGDEAYFVVNGYDFVGDEIPEAVLLVRTANLNVRIEYQLHGAFDQDTELDDFTMPDDIQDMMVAAGEDALAQVGT